MNRTYEHSHCNYICQVFETIDVSFILLDPDFKIACVNEAGCKILKSAKEELNGLDFSRFLFTGLSELENKSAILSELREMNVIRKRRSYILTDCLGKTPVDITYTALRNGEGGIVGISCVVYGLTGDPAEKRTEELIKANEALKEEIIEHRKTERKLKQSIKKFEETEADLKLFEYLINQTNDSIFVIDSTDCAFLHVNDKACSSLGYTKKELLNMNAFEMKANMPVDFSWDKFIEDLEESEHMLFESLHQKKDGTWYPVEVGINFIRHQSKDYIVIVARNITLRKVMENELKKHRIHLEELVKKRTLELEKANTELKNRIAERKKIGRSLRERQLLIRSIAEATPDIFFVYDYKRDKYIYINRMFNKILGYDRFRLKKMGTSELLKELLLPEDLRKRSELHERLTHASNGEVVEIEHQMKDVNGKFRWFSTRETIISRKKNNSPDLILGLVQDISERKRTEERIKSSLEEKDLLLLEIHHRVKNNLQLIISLLEMTADKSSNKETIELFSHVKNRLYSMSLIHSMLYQNRDFKNININDYIRCLSVHLLEMYTPESKKINIVINGPDVYLALTQAVPLGLVINELVTNVFKHAFTDVPEGQVNITIKELKTGYVSLVIADSGVGIPKKLSVKEINSLGLKLVRNIIHGQLRGKFTIRRKKGTEVGLKFKILKEV